MGAAPKRAADASELCSYASTYGARALQGRGLAPTLGLRHMCRRPPAPSRPAAWRLPPTHLESLLTPADWIMQWHCSHAPPNHLLRLPIPPPPGPFPLVWLQTAAPPSSTGSFATCFTARSARMSCTASTATGACYSLPALQLLGVAASAGNARQLGALCGQRAAAFSALPACPAPPACPAGRCGMTLPAASPAWLRISASRCGRGWCVCMCV
jgi:hypothetical protein